MDLLRLVAFDPEDLAVISAHLQDSLLRVGDIAYLPRERRFAIQTRRYDWEAATPQRRLTCMHFENVTGVRVRGIELIARPVASARTWLLHVGWRRHGLLGVDELPASA